MSPDARAGAPSTNAPARDPAAITALAQTGTARAARVPADRTTTRRRFAVVALIEVEDGVTHEAIYQRITTLNADGLREVYLDVDPDWAHYEVLRENAELDVEAATS